MASRELKVEIVGDSRSLERALGKASSSSSRFGSTFAKAGKAAALGLVAVGVGAAVAGKKMIDMASDAAEVDSKLDVVFGKALPELTKNIEDFSEKTGASKFALREQAADMGALLEPLTKTKKGAADMSVQFVKLATDLGSFNNVPVADALLAIRSGLVGEAEPLRRFGVLLNATAVGTQALKMGLAETTKELTEQDKVQARAALIMQQTTLAQGDATRTAGSMANQMKALRNNISDAATEMGAKLIPFALAAVKAFNDNWPQIEKVVDSVMSMLITGAEKAVAAVRTHFNTIKTVVTTAFQGAIAAGRKLISFFQTDLGQSIGIGIAAILAMKSAMGALGISVGGVGKALMVLKGNPMWALLIPLGLLVGELAGNFIKAKIDAAQLSEELSRASDNAKQLRDSLDALKQTEISERQAKHNLAEAAVGVRDAQKQVNDAVKQYGPNSAQAQAAVRGLEGSLLNYEQATLDVTTATKAHTTAEQARANELARAQQKITDLTAIGEKFQSSSLAMSQLLPRYSAAIETLGRNAGKTAVELQKTDPAASRASAKAAFLADVAVDLAEKLGRVPTQTEIIAEAKAKNFPKFYAELLNIAKRLSDAKATALAGGDAIGAALGTGMLQGIVRSKVAAVTAAASMVLESLASMRSAAGAKSPSKETEKLGKDISDGLLIGYLAGTAQLPEKMSEKLRKSIDAMVAVVNASKARTSTAFQQLATDAMTAFDAATQSQLDRIQKNLDAKLGKIAGNLSKALKKIDLGQAALTPAEKALEKLDRSEAVRGLQEGLRAAQQALAEAAASGDMDAVLAAQRQLRDAQLALQRDSLQQQADRERAAADRAAEAARTRAEKQAAAATLQAQKQAANQALQYQAQRDLQQRHLQLMLDNLEAKLLQGDVTWRQAHKRIMLAFKDEFGPDMSVAGKNLGVAFGRGLRESINGVGSAAADLARAIARYLKLGSPTEAGPMSDLDAWWKPLTQMLASQLNPMPIVQAATGVGEALKSGIQDPTNTIIGTFGGFARAKDQVIDNLGLLQSTSYATLDPLTTGLVDPLEAASRAASGGEKALRGLIGGMLAASGTTTSLYVNIFETVFRKEGGFVTEDGTGRARDSGKYYGYQHGGIARTPQFATIAENGPEVVLPLNKWRGMGGGTNVYVTVQGQVTSERDLVASIRNALVQEGRRSGGNLLGGYA